jgi:hypothetical protein
LEGTVKGHLVVTGIARLAGPVLAAVAWACLGAAGVAGAPEGAGPPGVPATYDLPALREGVRQARLRLRDLLAEYLFNTLGPGGELGWSTSRTVYATRGPLRYIRITHFDGLMPEELDITENEGFFTGTTFDVFYRRSGYYETLKQSPEQTTAWPLRGDYFIECLGWWPAEDTTRPPQVGGPFYLHKALDEPGYVVLPFQEERGGALCHVVELPGVDRLWIDPQTGFSLRGRLRFSGQPPVLVARYELSDFRQVGPGIWIPWRLRRTTYDSLVRQGEQGPRLNRDVVAAVERVQINDVPEELFRFTPPPGALVQDRDAHKTWQIPGGLSFLEDVTAVARRRLDVYQAHDLDTSRGVGAVASTWGTPALAGVVLFLGLLNLVCLAQIGRRLVALRRRPADEQGARGRSEAQGSGGAELPRAAPGCC